MREEAGTLAAKQAITEVLHLYARGWDRRDRAALDACFHPGSRHRHGDFSGSSADFIEMGLAIMASVPSCSHLITNILIDVRGESAVAESSFLSHHERPDDDRLLKGRYVDRFERRAGDWRIVERVGLSDFMLLFDRPSDPFAAVPAEQLSARSPADILYRFLRELRG